MARTATTSPYTRSVKSKSVTFTGSRKVKCDERQENGCGVCERARVTCAGYGIELCWTTSGKKDQQMARRRSIKPDPLSPPAMTEDEISKTVSALDAISAPLNTVVIGPFALFQTNNASPASGRCDDPQSLARIYHKTACPTSPNSCQDEITGHVGEETSDPVQGDRCWEKMSMQEDITDVERPWSQNVSLRHDPPASRTDPGSSRSHSDDSTSLPVSGASTGVSQHLELSMPLFRDRKTSMLIHHYVNHVAELLQPVLHPGNPWRTKYFPLAMEGCSDLIPSWTSTAPSSYASTALFHGILSAAAFHLRNATHDSAEFYRLALQHRIKALHALNAVAILPRDQHLYTVYLTAMLSMVTIDTMAGEDSDFPIHLQGCHRLQKPSGYTTLPTDNGGQVESIYRFLTLLARTTAAVVEPRPWPASDSDLHPPPHFRSDERSIEYMYGVTPALCNLLQRTCQIAEHLAFYSRHGDDQPPKALLDACQALGETITTWSIEAEPLRLIQPQEHVMFEIVSCQALAFHRAVLLYYHRTMRNSAIAVRAIDVEREVKSICENLTLAENLKEAFLGGGKRAAPMSWPAFIAACEARDRQCWVEWWDRVEGYCLGNLTRQWRIIRELWHLRDTDESCTDWRNALRQTGKSVLPI